MKLQTLITSGAYVGEEMQAEFGRLPPAFLPIGASFVIQHQLSKLTTRESLWLSLPSDFEATPAQEKLLAESEFKVLRVDPSISLGLSIFQCLLEIGPERPIEIIHGDTIASPPTRPAFDTVSISGVSEQYRWGLVDVEAGFLREVHDVERSDHLGSGSTILSGYFLIQEPWRFLKCIVARDFSFTGALDTYARERSVIADREIRTLDCGHLKTFYASRRNLAAARHFNAVGVEGGVFKKRSDDRRKVDAEAHWLRTAPAELQPFTARLIENVGETISGEYSTLYYSYPTVAELYLARSSQFVWRRIMNSCVEYLGKASAHIDKTRESPFEWLVVGKLKERIKQYPDFLPRPDELLTINGRKIGTLDSIVTTLAQVVERSPSRLACVMHGDFCFSNILYDLRSDRIQLIDPRGLIGNEVTIYGDLRYDIAKLGHSILGRYDQIIGEGMRSAGEGAEFTLEVPRDALRTWLEQEFLSTKVGGLPFEATEIKAAIVSLFLSMIPLHGDDTGRQRTLLASGLRLFRENFHDK